MSRKLIALGLVGLALAGCTSDGEIGPKATAGGATGAVVGGLIGAATGHGAGNIIAGALIGGLVGGVIGNALDEDDKRRAYDAEMQALEYGGPGAPVSWRGDTGNYGTIVPGPAYSRDAYARCREYTHTIYINNRPQTARGTACRNPDGSWSPVAG